MIVLYFVQVYSSNYAYAELHGSLPQQIEELSLLSVHGIGGEDSGMDV